MGCIVCRTVRCGTLRGPSFYRVLLKVAKNMRLIMLK
jgi:hypothetical protein